MSIDLQPFCSGTGKRLELQSPFTYGDYTYATNGHIMVRVERRDDVDEEAIGTKAFVFRGYLTGLPDITFSPFPTVVLPPLEAHVPKPCKSCNATGRIYKVLCVNCHGSGLVTCHACDHENDCRTCDGYGVRERPATTEDAADKVEDCDNCGGSGDASTDDDRIIYARCGPYFIDRRYVVLMQTLPGIEIDLGRSDLYEGKSTYPVKPILFRFDGGIGAIMPLSGPWPASQKQDAEAVS